MFTDLGEITIT